MNRDQVASAADSAAFAAQVLARAVRRDRRVCQHCQRSFWGTLRAKFCSATCRRKAWRKEQLALGLGRARKNMIPVKALAYLDPTNNTIVVRIPLRPSPPERTIT